MFFRLERRRGLLERARDGEVSAGGAERALALALALASARSCCCVVALAILASSRARLFAALFERSWNMLCVSSCEGLESAVSTCCRSQSMLSAIVVCRLSLLRCVSEVSFGGVWSALVYVAMCMVHVCWSNLCVSFGAWSTWTCPSERTENLPVSGVESQSSSREAKRSVCGRVTLGSEIACFAQTLRFGVLHRILRSGFFGVDVSASPPTTTLARHTSYTERDFE